MTAVRPASTADAATIVELITALAEYEKLPVDPALTEAAIAAHLFGPKPFAEALIAEADGAAVGFALFFGTYSTFRAKPGLYLEDLFVKPAFRGLGLGKALLVELARLAVARGCARVEWAVLDWNTPSIEFYQRLGAEPVDGWTTYRWHGEALRLAAE